MPDIDPAALSRPAASLSTPILKSITVSAPTTQKVTKTSQIIPARIDLEPLYTALKSSIGIEQWTVYKESTTQFLLGKLSPATQIHGISDVGRISVTKTKSSVISLSISLYLSTARSPARSPFPVPLCLVLRKSLVVCRLHPLPFLTCAHC